MKILIITKYKLIKEEKINKEKKNANMNTNLNHKTVLQKIKINSNYKTEQLRINIKTIVKLKEFPRRQGNINKKYVLPLKKKGNSSSRNPL